MNNEMLLVVEAKRAFVSKCFLRQKRLVVARCPLVAETSAAWHFHWWNTAPVSATQCSQPSASSLPAIAGQLLG
jgi:hypothetical protein